MTGRQRGLIEPDRIRKTIAFIVAAKTHEERARPTIYGFLALTGDRAGTGALTVTRNCLIFGFNGADALIDLDLEDYH